MIRDVARRADWIAMTISRMAQLWTFDDSRGWTPRMLDAERAWLFDGLPWPIDSNGGSGMSCVATTLLRRLADPPNTWALVTSDTDRVRVNGMPAALGIVVLADRDEIRTGDRTVWFSTEARPAVERFPESTPRGSCPRCKQPIAPGVPAVCCPSCGVWHHSSEEWPCWSYSATCALCNQPTPLDTPYRWSPEDL